MPNEANKPEILYDPESFSKVVIAIPVFNEVNYVDDILLQVSRYSNNIVVVDDGSTDGTGLRLEGFDGIDVITHDHNEGYGKSLIDAFGFAEKKGYEWIITMDCDYQHQPSCIPRFVAEIEKNDADIISGSRYLRSDNLGSISPPVERVAINKRITSMLNTAIGIKLTDAFCGFKAYRVESVQRLELVESGYGLPLQLWVQASKANLVIREIGVPLIYHDGERNFGGVLENPNVRLEYYLNIIQRELKSYDTETGKAGGSKRSRRYICEPGISELAKISKRERA